MTRPKLLDLFCGGGGAAVGYDRAGFDVLGVDIEPQPSFPFAFRQADALEVLADREFVAGFDALHLSPVCLTFTRVTDWRGSRANYPDTLTPSLALLEGISVPWVVENVEEAPLRADFLLCGSQFGLRDSSGRVIKRHRHFQLGNWACYPLMPPCDHHRVLPFMHKGERAYADAMGCTWMSAKEARQAIPPAYTAYIGGHLMEHLTAGCAA